MKMLQPGLPLLAILASSIQSIEDRLSAITDVVHHQKTDTGDTMSTRPQPAARPAAAAPAARSAAPVPAARPTAPARAAAPVAPAARQAAPAAQPAARQAAPVAQAQPAARQAAPAARQAAPVAPAAARPAAVPAATRPTAPAAAAAPARRVAPPAAAPAPAMDDFSAGFADTDATLPSFETGSFETGSFDQQSEPGSFDFEQSVTEADPDAGDVEPETEDFGSFEQQGEPGAFDFTGAPDAGGYAEEPAAEPEAGAEASGVVCTQVQAIKYDTYLLGAQVQVFDLLSDAAGNWLAGDTPRTSGASKVIKVVYNQDLIWTLANKPFEPGATWIVVETKDRTNFVVAAEDLLNLDKTPVQVFADVAVPAETEGEDPTSFEGGFAAESDIPAATSDDTAVAGAADIAVYIDAIQENINAAQENLNALRSMLGC